jgi:hypothetical protein
VDVTGDAFGSELCELFEQCADTITELRVNAIHTASFAHNVSLLRNLTALFVLHGNSYQSLPQLDHVQEFILPSAYMQKIGSALYRQLPVCGSSCRVLVLSDALGFTPHFNLRGFLQRCQALDTLSLGNVEQLGVLLGELGGCERPWRALRLTDSWGSSTEPAVAGFLRARGSSLLHLDLAMNYSSLLLDAIALYCPHLQGLCLLGTLVTSPRAYGQLQSLFRACPHLREIFLADVPLNNTQLQDLAEHCPRLECLGLSLQAEGPTAAGLRTALQQLPRLQEVIVPGVATLESAPPALLGVLHVWARAGPGRACSAAGHLPVLPFWRRWVQL